MNILGILVPVAILLGIDFGQAGITAVENSIAVGVVVERIASGAQVVPVVETVAIAVGVLMVGAVEELIEVVEAIVVDIEPRIGRIERVEAEIVLHVVG